MKLIYLSIAILEILILIKCFNWVALSTRPEVNIEDYATEYFLGAFGFVFTTISLLFTISKIVN